MGGGFSLLALALTLGVAGCQPSLPPLTPQEQATMQTLTHAMTPRCIGRYLIDLPASMVPSGWGGLKAQGVNIEVAPLNESLFRWRYEQREAELRAAHLDAHPDQPVLKEIIPLRGAIGGIFNRSENGGSNGSRTLELHAWRDGYAIKMWVNAADSRYPEYKDDLLSAQIGTDVPQKQALLLDVFARIRGRADNEIPSEQGLCFHGGFVQGPATDEENLDMDYVFTDMPDVSISIHNNSNLVSENTLLDRGKDIDANLRIADGHTLRKGKRQSHDGLAFDEWLMEANTDDHVKATCSRWKPIAGSVAPRRRCSISIFKTASDSTRPTSARPAPCLWTVRRRWPKPRSPKGRLFPLWDAITDTLRPRPNGF